IRSPTSRDRADYLRRHLTPGWKRALCKFGTSGPAGLARSLPELPSQASVPNSSSPIIVCLNRTLAHDRDLLSSCYQMGNLSVARHKTHMDLGMTSRSRCAYSGPRCPRKSASDTGLLQRARLHSSTARRSDAFSAVQEPTKAV